MSNRQYLDPSMHVFLETHSQPTSLDESSIANSIASDSTRPHVPRKLHPVSTQPVIRFPPDTIFQIKQCLEPYTSVINGKSKDLVATNGTEFLLNDAFPSSVASHDYSYTDLGRPSNEVLSMTEALHLPINKKCADLISFNETLVVSRMDPEQSTDDLDKTRHGGHPKIHQLLKVDRLTPLGGMSINVETVDDKFAINMASQFSYDGKQTASSTIQATCSNDLQFEYEKRSETLCCREQKHVCLGG